MRRALLVCALLVATAGAAALYNSTGCTDGNTTSNGFRPVRPVRRHLHQFGSWKNNFNPLKYTIEKLYPNPTDASSTDVGPTSSRRASKERLSTVRPGADEPKNESRRTESTDARSITEGYETNLTNQISNASLTDDRWIWMESNATAENFTIGNRVALTGDGCPKGLVRITNSLCAQPE